MGKKLNIVFSLLLAVIFTLAAGENNTRLYQLGDTATTHINNPSTANSIFKFGAKTKVPAKVKYIIRTKAITNWDVDNPITFWLPKQQVFFYYNSYSFFYKDCLLTNTPLATSLRGPPAVIA